MKQNTQHRIVIIAGEASGDKLGAYLISQVTQNNNDTVFSGLGGNAMQSAGATLWYDFTKLSATGITEIIFRIPKYFQLFQQTKRNIKACNPDLLILIDCPEFNLRLAKWAKKQNIKILYYSSPQVWAWKQKRIHVIKETIDKMAVFYPFEVDFYRKHNVPVSLVQHPLSLPQKKSLSKDDLLTQFGLTQTTKIIGLFPGSRHNEVKRLLPILCESAKLLKEQYPNTAFIIPIAPSLDPAMVEKTLGNVAIDIIATTIPTTSIIPLCDTIIAASGTVTLEITFHKIPMVIIYKFSALSYTLLKTFANIHIKHMGLCNLIANKRIVPELFQYKATPENIVACVREFMENKDYRKGVIAELNTVHHQITGQDRANIGHIVNEIVNQSPI